jgi:hypothetical protein
LFLFQNLSNRLQVCFIPHCICFLLFSSTAVSEEVDLYVYYKALQLKTWEQSFQNQEFDAATVFLISLY